MSSSESDEFDVFLARRTPKARVFRERENFLTSLDEEKFLRRFRMSKASFNVLLGKIDHKIAPKTKRSYAINSRTKLFATLRFYATGSFLLAVGDLSGISEAFLSRIVVETSKAIAELRNEYIFLPRNEEELNRIYENFFKIAGFPTVVGTIDCTHVKIKGQGGAISEVFRNRKQFFSINVQSVCGPDLKFIDVVARWPGSTHDSHIFNQSKLKERFDNNELKHGVLLGDGGYALKPYLMTPYRNPVNDSQKAFNKAQIKTRNTVERKYGIWKRRFPCLAFGLRCKLETSLIIIVACAVLHKFCIDLKDPVPPLDDDLRRAIEETTIQARHDHETAVASSRHERVQANARRDVFADRIGNRN